jgi:hypothetical protein
MCLVEASIDANIATAICTGFALLIKVRVLNWGKVPTMCVGIVVSKKLLLNLAPYPLLVATSHHVAAATKTFLEFSNRSSSSDGHSSCSFKNLATDHHQVTVAHQSITGHNRF